MARNIWPRERTRAAHQMSYAAGGVGRRSSGKFLSFVPTFARAATAAAAAAVAVV